MSNYDEQPFGASRPFIEGAPKHPDDAYESCGCDDCMKVMRRQMKAWIRYMESHGHSNYVTEGDRERAK